MPSSIPKQGQSLSDLFPEVAREWHPTKNGLVAPDQVTKGSSKNFWWKCTKNGDHAWKAQVNSRTGKNKTGCPRCARIEASKPKFEDSLAALFPDVAAQWHPTKNGDSTPEEVFPAAREARAWWKCDAGLDHEWEGRIGLRTVQGYGCPFCDGKKVSVTNSLASLFPDLALEWHPTKNGELTPSEIVAGGHKKIWWKCDAGSDHEWVAVLKSRSFAGRGCPFCDGKKVSVTNSLASLFPDLALEWHPTKNGELTPSEVVAGGHKKIWWKCDAGSDHEWVANLGDRSFAGRGCPFCDGKKVSVTNSLASLFPDLALEWHPTKNGELTPADFVYGTTRRVWWKCVVAADHEWEGSLNNRTNQGEGRSRGCPFCDGKKVSVTNSLASLFPDLALEWHPTKNGELTPQEVTAGNPKKAWWKCSVFEGHEWESTIGSRTTNSAGCPLCTLTPRSAPEIRLAYELSALIDFDLEEHKVRLNGRLRDIDIVIRELQLLIEYDGAYWHRNKAEKDIEKTTFMEEAGWKVIRVREQPLESIHKNDVMTHPSMNTKTVADLVIKKISQVAKTEILQIDKYLASGQLWREKESTAAIRAYQAENAAKRTKRKMSG
jgi:hypothetical protein